MTKRQIGLQIRKHRELKGLSQAQLGTLTDLPATRISEIELGKSNITLNRLLAVCDALNLEIDLIKGKIAQPVKSAARLTDSFDNL